MLTDDVSTPYLDLADDADPSVDRPTGHVTLLFGLSLATALPPAAILVPPGGGRPAAQSDLRPILDLLELAAVLKRPTAELWRGRVTLGQIDERLRGLETLLHVVRVIDGSGALVCLSAVSPEPAAEGTGATPADLWEMACQALARCEIPYESQVGIGEAAFLAVYGGVTAQVAWLAGNRLATASVTSLAGEQTWAVEAARSIAVLLDRRLSG
jgi:hypothetical protein